MSITTCSCGKPVTNETAGTSSAACDDCRNRWRREGLPAAIQKCLANGYRVIDPDGKEIVPF